ncbi:copper resistance CopC/CopD family protein [Sinorhizobium alkalisoli]|uniref:Copper resistance protein CopC n=1 Tax=Sinorhizobium alkalisoli TaxID=1752398 RepID=A0A1E3VF40_9HYPH|nr:copper resistance CopC/CopD family protein [Sinorhizobium alkalisoli]ODR92154.1 copper resistance protein CopC [Sinorhizobium alkalisoli]
MRGHFTLAMPAALSRIARVVTLALCGVLAQIAVASAHASYTSSDPEDGAVVETAPSRFAIAFSEPVSPLSLRLVRPDGSSIPLERFEVKDRTVEIVAPTGLGRGTHVLSWRVISADGHPVGGSVVFSISEADAAPPPIVDQIDRTVRAGVLGSKVALYIGLFIGVGGMFASVWLLGGSRPGRHVVGGALGIGILGALASAGFQGLDALAAPVARIAEPIVWSTAMATSFGHTVIVAVLALALAAAAHQSSKGPISRPSSFLALILAGLALSLSGHAAAAEPQWLTRPAVFVHAAAIAFWVGALAPLGLALKRCDPAAVAGLRRFSAMVPFAVAALVAAGVTLVIVQVQQPHALFGTAYGRVLLVKLGLLAGLFLLAAINRWSLTAPVLAGDGPATTRLVRIIAAETAIVLLIFTVVASWRFTPPPRALAAAAAQPASVHIHTDNAMAFIQVMPGRAGDVEVSINVLTGEFQKLDAKEVTLALAKPESGIEPFRRPAVRRSETDWRIDQMTIPLPGVWHVRVEILISDFDMVRLEGQLSIRP